MTVERKDRPPLSIVIPARNEAEGLRALLPELNARFPDAEILVVDDGSSDDTALVCASHRCHRIENPTCMGNGAAIKRGARAAQAPVLAMLDGDGQHTAGHLQAVLERFHRSGADMVVGARRRRHQASGLRFIGNWVFNRLASWMTGHAIPDLTSGLRVVRTRRFREFLHLLPNGFSYPTTSTMAFFRSAYVVDYLYVDVGRRHGSSHLKIWREGSRFLLIIFKIGSLYSPMKLFLPISIGLFLLASSLYTYTYFAQGRFTNMSALLYMTSLLTFLIGIVSEQITNLMYARRDHHRD